MHAIRTAFKIADETEAVTDQLLTLLRLYPTGGKQIHDANIVATMIVYGITTLLTNNVNDVRRFADRITIITLWFWFGEIHKSSRAGCAICRYDRMNCRKCCTRHR
jgi:hypothetical protein